MAIDHYFTVADAEQIGERAALVTNVALRLTDALSGVFQQPRAFGDLGEREAAGGVNVRRTDNETRQGWPPGVRCSGSIAHRQRLHFLRERKGGNSPGNASHRRVTRVCAARHTGRMHFRFPIRPEIAYLGRDSWIWEALSWFMFWSAIRWRSTAAGKNNLIPTLIPASMPVKPD